MSILVIKPGLLSSVQDRGRQGYASFGVGRAGAMDAPALQLANALLGNEADAAAIEITVIGPTLRFQQATRIALCGAEVEARLDQRPIAMWRPIEVAAGTLLDTSRMRRGARAYLAVAGGIASERVLGSRASDINAGLGASALISQQILRCSTPNAVLARKQDRYPNWSLDPRPWFDPDPRRPIRLMRGSHFEALDAASRHCLFHSEFRIARDSNRVGFRLEGETLSLQAPLELISEPVSAGTLQLPPSGQAIALMAEHPTTGGYPRIGQIAAIDHARLAQRRPGDSVRFAEIAIDEAQSGYLSQQRELSRLLQAIRERLQ